jgi:hypothetical protein
MLLYLVLDKWKLTRFLIPLLLAFLIIAVIFGYIEDKIGMAKEEYLIQAHRMGLLSDEKYHKGGLK